VLNLLSLRNSSTDSEHSFCSGILSIIFYPWTSYSLHSQKTCSYICIQLWALCKIYLSLLYDRSDLLPYSCYHGIKVYGTTLTSHSCSTFQDRFLLLPFWHFVRNCETSLCLPFSTFNFFTCKSAIKLTSTP
jgi:hypothetical protein